MSRLSRILLAAAILSGIVAGCGGSIEDTYMTTTIRSATRDRLMSPGFKFAFNSPEIVAVHKDVAMIREGNLLEFAAGQDLEGKLKEVAGKRYVMGTRKFFNPIVYFTVDYLAVGTDTISVGEPYEVSFPVLSKRYDDEDFQEIDLSALTANMRVLRPIINAPKFKVPEGTVKYEEVTYKVETGMMYTLNFENVRFIVDEPGDNIELILKALISENHFFVGGVTYEGRPTTSNEYRRSTKIAGKVVVDYIKYGGNIIISTS